MQLLVMRHGQAESMQTDDAGRELTKRGRAQVEWICQKRAQQLKQLHGIWVSPFVRTQQTATIIATQFTLPVITSRHLIGGTTPEQLLQTLQQTALKTFPLLLVSHQPLVGKLINSLCGSDQTYAMDTASLACLEADVWANGCAELRWLQHTEN